LEREGDTEIPVAGVLAALDERRRQAAVSDQGEELDHEGGDDEDAELGWREEPGQDDPRHGREELEEDLPSEQQLDAAQRPRIELSREPVNRAGGQGPPPGLPSGASGSLAESELSGGGSAGSGPQATTIR
jgi:hypothetical protein